MRQTESATRQQYSDASRTAFTPGPWTVDLRGERGTFHIPEAQRHEASAAGADGMDGYTVSKANARLISAAPTMFAALLAADEAINPKDRGGISLATWNDRLKEATKAIREALTKAGATHD